MFYNGREQEHGSSGRSSSRHASSRDHKKPSSSSSSRDRRHRHHGSSRRRRSSRRSSSEDNSAADDYERDRDRYDDDTFEDEEDQPDNDGDTRASSVRESVSEPAAAPSRDDGKAAAALEARRSELESEIAKFNDEAGKLMSARQQHESMMRSFEKEVCVCTLRGCCWTGRVC